MPTAPLDLPIDAAVAYADKKGKYKKRNEKRQQKNLQKIAPLLSRMLEPEEKILISAKAVSPMSFFEPMGMGWMVYYIKRCVLVLTDRRVLHFPTKADYAHRDTAAEVRFGDLEGVKSGSFLGRNITLIYKNGKKERFAQIQSPDFKRFIDALNLKLAAAAGSKPSRSMGRAHLCPRCTAPLSPGVYACPKCFLAFKDLGTARKYSIIFPGGGYFYTGQIGFGILDAIAETLIIITLVSGILALDRKPQALEILVLTGLALVIEKLVTIMHATHRVKEFLPAEKNPAAAPAAGPGRSARPLGPGRDNRPLIP